VAVLYILGSAAAWRLARGGVAMAGQPLKFRHLTAAMLVAIVSMTGMIALGSRAEILGLVGLLAVSALLYLVLSRFRKAV
jgi:hypothetical protein